jgi:hypothetical protein
MAIASAVEVNSTSFELDTCCQGGDMLDWTSDNGIREDVFLQRIEALSTLGYSVLLSNYRRYFKLAAYLSTFTQEPIVIAMGVPSLKVAPTVSLGVLFECNEPTNECYM